MIDTASNLPCASPNNGFASNINFAMQAQVNMYTPFTSEPENPLG
jgi:hypothetical protein